MDYNKLERNEAKRIGAKLHKNSGRGVTKGDMSTDQFMIDAKFSKKSFTLNQTVWAKVCMDAIGQGKDPMLYLIIGEDGGQQIRLAVIEYEVLQALLDEE